MPTRQGKHIDAMVGMRPNGVVYGLEGPDPGSGLSWVYTEGVVRIKAANAQGFTEYRIAGATIVTTATVDTYVYVDGSTGAVASTTVTAGAAKPKIGAGVIPANSEFLFKVGNDTTDIDEVVDLRQMAGVDLVAITVGASFEATEVGDTYVPLTFTGRVIAVDGHIVNAIAATDAGTVTPSIVQASDTATAITNGALSFAASAAVGVRDLECPSAANFFKAGDRLKSVSAKSTAGGLASVTYICERF
jgi:hypothetical protein